MDNRMKRIYDVETEAAELMQELAELKRYDYSQDRSSLERWCKKAADHSVALSAAIIITCAMLTAILREGQALAVLGFPVLSLLLLGVLFALAIPILIVVPDMIFMQKMARKPVGFYQSEYRHDLQHASGLVHHSVEGLALADLWIEQKMKRMERRMLRLLGGGDKVAPLVVGGLAWAVWKEFGREHIVDTVFGSFNAVQMGLALAAGMVLSGIQMSRMVEKLAFQRDMIALAKDKLARLSSEPEA